MSNNAHILVVGTVRLCYYVLLPGMHTTQAALLGLHQVLGVRSHSINDASFPSHWTLYMKEKSDAELAAATAPWNPSWRQTTLASFISQWVPQTSPQVPLKNTSTRPWDVPQPTNLTVSKTTNTIKLWKSYNVNCGVKNYLKKDHCSYIRNYCSCKRKIEWINRVICHSLEPNRSNEECVKSSEDSALRCNTTPTNQSNCI